MRLVILTAIAFSLTACAGGKAGVPAPIRSQGSPYPVVKAAPKPLPKVRPAVVPQVPSQVIPEESDEDCKDGTCKLPPVRSK